jgi:hypothetical protein
MVTFDSANRFRLSSSLSREAGFRPGQQLTVVSNSNNSFRIIPMRKTRKADNSPRYSVEKDGRIRVSETVLNNIGVRRSSRKSSNKFSANATRGSITVNI